MASRPKAKARPDAPRAAYAPALNSGFQATAERVQEMHQAIAGKTFDTLLHVPGLSMPTRIVQGVHDAISQGVYAAVRHGGGAALALAGGAERLAGDPARVPGNKERTLHAALNGVFGDALAAMSSPLAVQMGLHAQGRPLPLTRSALAGLRPRVVVFIHGLACDERSWSGPAQGWAGSPWAAPVDADEPVNYGGLLERELPVSAVYLRYNTGLAIDANAQALSDLLGQLLAAAPQVAELVLIGHSMGGLVARCAHAFATQASLAWARRTPMLICLGSPHQGAPLEQLGALASAALRISDVTQPLARMADARSKGIKDLRQGVKRSAAAARTKPPALKLVFGTLVGEADTLLGPLIGTLLGDGLVRAPSASDQGLQGDVERCEVAGLGHMALLSHPRVYALVRGWLGAADAGASTRA